jgi:mRNA interferase YafQ
MARTKKPPPPDPAPTPSPPLLPSPTAQFRKDVKAQEKRGKDIAKLRTIVEVLANRQALDPRHKNHPLGGQWSGWWDCHVEPDWVLICKKTPTELILGRTGTHSDLFD